MAITGGRTPTDYNGKNKGFYIDKFIPLITENAPPYEWFTVHDIKRILDLPANEKKIYSEISNELRNEMVNRRLVEVYPGIPRQLKLISLQAHKADKISSNTVINHGNIGQVYQDFEGLNNPIATNDAPAPIKNETKSIWLKIWLIMTKHPLVVGIILIVISLILYKLGFKS